MIYAKKIAETILISFILSLGLLIPPHVYAAQTINVQNEYIYSLSGETENDYSGSSVASAGDVNGDGYDDVIVGAPGNGAGSAYIIYGNKQNSSINLANASVKLIGENNGDEVGHSVASAGDVNGDGYDDVIVGAYGNDAGAVYIVYGGLLSGEINLTTANVKFIGENSGDKAGFSVASAGDVNGDGYDDVIVGAYGNDAGGDLAGAAYVVFGGKLSGELNLKNANVKFYGTNKEDIIGYSVATAGDFNTDGYDDILISAHGDDTTGGNTGAAYMLYGSSSLSGTFNSSNVHVKFVGPNVTAAQAGYAVASAGDVNKDGYTDILISAHQDSAGGSWAGSVYVVYGKKDLTGMVNLNTADVKFIGEASYNYTGRSVASAGDVNKDGYDDLIIGAEGDNSGAGAAYLIYGGNLAGQINLSTADVKFVGKNVADAVGHSVASAGDVNGDGYDDVIVGAYGVDNGSNIYTGTTYLILPYIDSDGDGLLADSCVVNGSDTNDSISNYGIEIDGDSIDNDFDGIVDEYNTVGENGIHPYFGSFNPSSQADYIEGVDYIAGISNGDIVVQYADNSIYHYSVFTTTTSKTTIVRSYQQTGRLIVIDTISKKSKIINAYTGEVLK